MDARLFGLGIVARRKGPAAVNDKRADAWRVQFLAAAVDGVYKDLELAAMAFSRTYRKRKGRWSKRATKDFLEVSAVAAEVRGQILSGVPARLGWRVRRKVWWRSNPPGEG
jgi:hypothetical protein